MEIILNYVHTHIVFATSYFIKYQVIRKENKNNKNNLFTHLYRSGFHPSFNIISAFPCSFPSLWSDSTELELDDVAPNKPAREIVSFCNDGFSFAEQL